MWGVGCGKSSYFCWQGNVCLPKSVPCNGYCTQYYKRIDQMSCAFDQDLLIGDKEEIKGTNPGGTLSPLVTIMLLVCATFVGVLISFRKHIMEQVERMRRRKPVEEREPSMSELEVMELDPFSPECRDIKTFSVRNGLRTHDSI